MAHTYSRDKLEENRRKRAAAAAQTTIKAAPMTNPQKVVFGNTANKTTASAAPKASKPSVMPSVTRTNPQKVVFGQSSLTQQTPKQTAPKKITFSPIIKTENTPYNPKTDTTRRANAARNRENQRRAVAQDHQNLQINQQKWFLTSDPAQKASLHQQNNEIRKRLGLQYDAQNGVIYTKDGKNLSLGVQMLHGRKAGAARQFDNVRESKEFNARAKDQITARPTIHQTMQGVTKDDLVWQTGVNAHKAMRNLFNRSDETWSREDTTTRDRARQELTDEMYRIFERYGLNYVPRENTNTADVMRKLRAAGADNQTLAYVQENIDLRAASDRLGQGMTAVGNRIKASIPSLLDTAGQARENRSEDYQNDNYTRLYEREKELETQLQNMVSQNADGSVPAEYQAVYDELQRVRNERNSIAVQKGVDPNKWSQRTLREANEAQLNATAGLSPAPRWLAEQGISLAGNAPTMAASAIPIIGPALGTAVIGAQAAGQRAFELNEAGKSAGEALGRGLVSGMIEAATEKLPLEQMADILHSGGTGAVKSILRQMGTEATEEGVSYFLNYVADRAAADPDAKFSLSELVQNAAGGAFGGLVFGTAGNIGAKLASSDAAPASEFDSGRYARDFVTEIQQAYAELQAAKSLPSGVIRDLSIESAYKKLSETLDRFSAQQTAAEAELAARNGAFEGAQEKVPTADIRKYSTSIDTNPATHTVEQMNLINEYVDSVDENLKNYAERVLNGEKVAKTYNLKPVSDRAINDIFKTINVDARGFQTKIEPRMIEHINRRHGSAGAADTSMANLNDVARMQYVMDNYDSMTDGGVVESYREPRNDGTGRSRKARSVIYEKQVDGTYYLVQAVPDTKSKTSYIVSAFMQKNNGTQNNTASRMTDFSIHDAQSAPIGYTSETDSTHLSTNSIRRNEENSNGSGEKTANVMQETPEGASELLTQTLVKLDREMRAAQNLPDGTIKNNQISRLAQMENEVSDKLRMIEKNRSEFQRAQAIAEKLGAKVQFAFLEEAGGKYENGVITINPYTENLVQQVLVHELTHHLESSGSYQKLQDAALRAFSEEQGVSVDVLRENITKLYANKGVTLNADGANRELTAAYCENRLFKDENSIEQLAQTDVSLFQRIRQWISDLVIRLRGTEEQKRVLEVQRLYEKAARNLGKVQDRGAQYQIRQDTENNDYVQVNEDILDGKTEKDHAAILRDIINNKFGNVIEANGQRFGINSKTNGEWRRSKDASALYSTDKQTYYDKIRAFNNADELMQTSTDYVGEAPKHPRKDNFKEFARGKVNYKVGENGYTADIVVGITGSGGAYLYDIVNIKDKKITESPLLVAMTGNLPKPLVGDSVENSIAQGAAESNGFEQNTFGFSTREIAHPNIMQDAMQYGKTPEQAVMEAKVKRESAAAHTARELYRNIVSGQAEIERFAQVQKKLNPAMPDANDLAQINRVAGSTVDTIAEKALVDRKGDVIGKGWLETVGGLSKEQLAELNLYRLHEHNIDRMSIQGKVFGELGQVRKQYEAFLKENPEYTTRSEETIREIARFGEPEQQTRAKKYLELKAEMERLQRIRNKPVLAKKDANKTQDRPYTAQESEKILREMDEKNPQLAEWAAKAEDFHDAFMWEWVVGSGLMSAEQYERLKEYYPHYVQTYRVAENWGGGTDTTRRGNVNTGSPTKQAIGSLKEIIPFEDAEMMQVNSLVKNARRNELFCNIYEFAQEHPEEAASYVRIVEEDDGINAQPLSFDDLTGDMAEAAMSDQGGIYTIRAMVDGKPITMQVNSAFYAGLQNLFGQDRGASDSFMKKTFGTMTNAFKIFTTGKNPLFFLTNLPKDFQTAYINTTSSRKTLLTWLADVGVTVKHMAANDADWQAFQALGGAGGGFYHNEKGFTRSVEDAGKHRIIKKIWEPIDAVSENTEALWRFNEYRAAIQQYGDTEGGRAKAIQAAADVTTNFSRSAPATKAAENYCAYLNASVQGLDKIVRQVKEHPILTARRAAEIIALPTLLLYLINKDDDDYKNLNNRTKDNYYCIPIGGGDFLKIPKSREYGVVMGALLERFFRLGEGEEAESAFKGIGEQFMTNLAPSNPVTDNILKTVFIDLPTNRDFAGRSIVPERMEGLSPENQYDYTTSGAGMAIAKGWNATLGRVAGEISPIQADYLIDSNLGFVGDAIIGATTDPKSPEELAKELQENPVKTMLLPVFNTVKQKFTANPLYQSGVTDAFYDELDAAQRAANDKNLTENLDADIVTPEETYYSALNKSSSEISELRKQERTILADKSLSAEEQEEKVRDIRRQIIEIAKNAKAKAQQEREEYEKTYISELSPLSETRQKDGREAMQHGLSAKQFVKWDTRFSDLKNKKNEDGKHIYSEAEARGRVLKEIMADDTLRSGEKQALADYVILSTMGDNDKEKWNDEVKGKVNASDYVRFKSDVAAYEKEYSGSGTDNAANVRRIIDGYENLNDEQKSLLMSVYTENASKNLYHVSTYEQQIDKSGSFYKDLNQSGRDELRSMLNEYESNINEGKELDEWKAKAYMAEKEADISPATYAMYQLALKTAKGDKNNPSQAEAEASVKQMDGLTQYQKAYLYQSTKTDWKKNPFGSATVGKYESTAETGINPVEGSTVSSPFGPRQTFTTSNGETSSKNHHSIDLAAAAGTPIKAFESGKVTANGWVSGYGWTIEVTHPNGLISQYHHMQNQSGVAVGTEVKQGQQIGSVGSTGKSTGPHLDLSIIKDGKYIDPASVIPALKDSESGYISTDAASYGALMAAASSSKKSSGSSGKRSSGSSGGTTWSGMKNLDNLNDLKGLPKFG